MRGKVKIKALSVNSLYQGRRFRTPAYSKYINDVTIKLPKFELSESKLKLNITFGFSSKLQDLDGALKGFIDCLVKKYGVDDRYIFELNLKKEIVPKGHEFIDFNFEYLE